jgi:hypothetical protein
MPICPICGYRYPEIYQVTEPSVCLVCCLDIEIASMEISNRRQGKIIWSKKIALVHEEMLPIILHPDRIQWFLPDRYAATFCV